jgi:adenylate cyclase
VAGVEIERKWLVPKAPADALAAPSELIEQGYLTIGSDGTETRLRRRGERCSLTVKSGSGMTRAEHEVELSAEQFAALWPATEGARLLKRRHLLRTEEGRVIELDVYEGGLGGLMVAEVEFDDPWGAESFAAPYWFGPELTDDPDYKNQRLALRGMPPAPTSR